MGLFNRFKHGVDVTKFKADQLMRVNRVQGEIEGLRRQISEVRLQIAGAALNLHQKGALANPELEELCLKIDDLQRMIGDKEARIAAIRAEEPPPGPTGYYASLNPCPNCNFEVPPGAAFCTNCGNAMPAPAKPEEPASAGGGITCPNCQTQNPDTARFCTVCGHKLNDITKP